MECRQESLDKQRYVVTLGSVRRLMTTAADGRPGCVESELPLLPLKDIIVFPHMIVPVFISEDLCIQAVEKALEGERKIFLSAFQATEPHLQDESLVCTLAAPFDVYDVGTVCSIMRTRRLPDGRMKVLVQGVEKATISQLVSTETFPLVSIQALPEPDLAHTQPEVEAMIRAVRENLEKVVSLGKVLSPDILMILEDVKEPGRLADLVAANLGLKVVEGQRILVVGDPVERLSRVHAYLCREIEVFQMQVRIQSQAKEEIGKVQREHYLREQIRALRSELGDADMRDEAEALWKQLDEVEVSEEAREELIRQMKRLERMHQDTSEAALTRTHIETLLSLPWDIRTEDNLDMKRAQETLDKDHYGLTQVKDRVLEYLAVKKLNSSAKSPILCFVGPPGVGKTSLGRSVAECMGRPFSRISLGGVRDEADIRGHRKTYVGAFPGRIISALKATGAMNPVIMLDEIDKLGSDHRGDPSSALLEVLDPEQNHKFVDHYLGVSFDLSEVMFIANANHLESIPHALRDRLEIIDVSGYSEDEKADIAKRFLLPKQIVETGLTTERVKVSSPALKALIRGYTRESGLRGLEKQVAMMCRKLARQVAEEDKNQNFRVTPTIIEKLLGAAPYGEDFFHTESTPGVSLGMAYTQYGGEILAIETNLYPGKGQLVLTGQLGDVMKESAHAALSYIRSRYEDFHVSLDALEKQDIHVHVPAGAVPKDGPSAGVAMATSILSGLLGVSPKSATCMTGEITSHGKVLPIGGLKEKLLAAQREGMKHVLLPSRNRSLYLSLPQKMRKNLEVIFVSEYQEAFEFLFSEVRVHTTPVTNHPVGLAS
ncbi:MAG: endopeptidase La [Oligoflexales bacterium]